nr:uncharacterized protein LOC109980137 [Labrus bergylta]
MKNESRLSSCLWSLSFFIIRSDLKIFWYKVSSMPSEQTFFFLHETTFFCFDLLVCWFHAGNTERTTELRVVQEPTVSDQLRPGDLMSLQCSVLSDPDSKTCPGGHSVLWFRAGSHESRPDIIYTAGNRRDGCEERSASQKSCVHHFSKNISSSDAGTYYCAVDTCGRLLFGDGTKVDVEGKFSLKETTVTFLLCAALALTLIVIAFLIHAIKTNNNASDALGENCDVWRRQMLESLKRDQVYSAVVFTVMKSKKGAKAAEKERIYAAVKAFEMDQ